MDRILDESIWFCNPDLEDVFLGRENAEYLEPAGEIVGRHEVGKVRSELIVVVENGNAKVGHGSGVIISLRAA